MVSSILTLTEEKSCGLECWKPTRGFAIFWHTGHREGGEGGRGKKEPNGPFVGRCLPEQMHMVISMTLYDLTEVCVPWHPLIYSTGGQLKMNIAQLYQLWSGAGENEAEGWDVEHEESYRNLRLIDLTQVLQSSSRICCGFYPPTLIIPSTHTHPFLCPTDTSSFSPPPPDHSSSYSHLFPSATWSHPPLLPLLIDVFPVNCYTYGPGSRSAMWPRKQAVPEKDWRGNEKGLRWLEKGQRPMRI